eukprot:Gb_32747 [translate_table: standard]
MPYEDLQGEINHRHTSYHTDCLSRLSVGNHHVTSSIEQGLTTLSSPPTASLGSLSINSYFGHGSHSSVIALNPDRSSNPQASIHHNFKFWLGAAHLALVNWPTQRYSMALQLGSTTVPSSPTSSTINTSNFWALANTYSFHRLHFGSIMVPSSPLP